MCLSVYVCPYLFVSTYAHIYTLVSILMCLCMYVRSYVTCSTCNISHLSHVHMLRVHMFMTHTCAYDHKSTSSYAHTCPCTNYIRTRMITGHMTTYTLDHSMFTRSLVHTRSTHMLACSLVYSPMRSYGMYT